MKRKKKKTTLEVKNGERGKDRKVKRNFSGIARTQFLLRSLEHGSACSNHTNFQLSVGSHLGGLAQKWLQSEKTINMRNASL